ncbi:hypothetical protein PHMEG_00014557 [Phytophthora megakarya]|uniref:RxLR effector protein n=1 Tax=Phytophthora megakarya TaxID=4795 RepID=A0A225W3H7_9STRA|nr:hypothetical protein PHMEG_00014557 [Phytophthora megakarya]
MRLIQVVLLLVALFATVVAKTKEDRLGTIEGDTIVFSTTPNGADVASVNGGTIVFKTTPNEGNPGGKVTVTTYNDDGIWARIKKWWKKLISREERLGYADARSTGVVSHLATTNNGGTGGIVSRVATGGTVAINDNNKGGGTVTVTVYNNNGLFERVKRWWQRIIARVTGGTTQRLRQRV